MLIYIVMKHDSYAADNWYVESVFDTIEKADEFISKQDNKRLYQVECHTVRTTVE